jgi:hypothetical protein
MLSGLQPRSISRALHRPLHARSFTAEAVQDDPNLPDWTLSAECFARTLLGA